MATVIVIQKDTTVVKVFTRFSVTGGGGTGLPNGGVAGQYLRKSSATNGDATWAGIVAAEVTDFSTAADARIATASVNALADVTVTTPVTNQVLKWNGTAWVNASVAYSELTGVPSTFAPSAHASSHQHGGSDEVATATPGANVIPKAGAGGKLASGFLTEVIGVNDLTDATTSSPSTGHVLRWNGSAWVNAVLAYGDLSGTPAAPDVQTFNSNGTWTKPAGARWVRARLIAGGGGGGSGRRGAASTARGGGNGGGGGAVFDWEGPASALGATETITVGAGGAGGAAVTSNDTNGNNGTNGGDSSLGSVAVARGGPGGLGGVTAVNQAQFGAQGNYPGGVGGTGTLAAVPPKPQTVGAGGGGGGATGISAINGVPASVNNDGGDSSNATGGTAPSGNGADATVEGGCGSGGAGGSNFGADGGNGGSPAGGGGGGAGVTNGSNSGKGGDGKVGKVIITTFF